MSVVTQLGQRYDLLLSLLTEEILPMYVCLQGYDEGRLDDLYHYVVDQVESFYRPLTKYYWWINYLFRPTYLLILYWWPRTVCDGHLKNATEPKLAFFRARQ